MNKSAKTISIIFPAYNEEKNIKKTVNEAYKFAEKAFKDFEIIVVDDGSVDNTATIVEEISNTKKKVKLLKNGRNLGYGATVWKGLKAAKKKLIFFSDADRQFDLREIASILEHVGEYDVVIGYRRKRKDPFLRKLNAWGWKLLLRLVLNLKVRDIDCAFKLFRRDVVEKVSVKSTGATFSAELIYNIKKKGFRIKEVGVGHYPRVAGSPTGAKLSVIKKAFVELWRFYRQDKDLVRQKSRFVYFGGAIILFLSRILLRSNSMDFFDSSEYAWRTNDASFLGALATGHAPFHPLYVFFSWLLHSLPFKPSEITSLEITSALMGSLSIVFLFLFVKKLFNSRVAWLSATIFSLLPFVWVSQTTILVDASEHTFYFLSLFLWLIALQSQNLNGKIYALCAGLSFGLAAFAHTQVAIWIVSILAMPILTTEFKRKSLLDLLYKFLLFFLGGSFFIYLYLELLLYSHSIGWHEPSTSYKAALKYLLFGNIGDRDPIEIKKTIYYLVSLASSVVVLTGLFGAIKMFLQEKRKLLFVFLWFIPFVIGSTYIYENLYARTLIIGLAAIAVCSAYFLLNIKKFKSIWIGLVLAQLIILSVPVVARYHNYPSPIENIKSFISTVEPDGIFISSNVTKTMANSAYKGEYVNFGDVGYGAGFVQDKTKQALADGKPVFVLSDALISPYRRYDGSYYDLRSVGTGNGSSHGTELENLFKNFNIYLRKVESYSFRRALYQVSNNFDDDVLNNIESEAKKSPIVFGRLVSNQEAVSGAIINNYNKNLCGTVKENITRLDFGLCLIRNFRKEPENWTFTDKDGRFYLPSDKPSINLAIGTNPGQTRVSSLDGQFAKEEVIYPQAKYRAEYTSLEELKSIISDIDRSYYVVSYEKDGQIRLRLYTYEFSLSKTNTIDAKNIVAEAGKIVKDGVLSKKVRVSDERAGYMASGPYMDLAEGKYIAVFSLRKSSQSKGAVLLDVSGDYGRIDLGKVEKNISELSSDKYKKIELPFVLQAGTGGVEFRVKAEPNSGIYLESIEIKKN